MRVTLLRPVPQLANAVLKSEAFDNAAWIATRSSVTADQTTGPFGTASADILVEDATAGNTHVLTQANVVTKSGPTLVRVWAKKKERTQIRVQYGTAKTADYDLDAGTCSATGLSATGCYILPAPNGFYECVLKVNADGTATNLIVFLMNPTVGYNGDGVSGAYLGGAMIHPGYIRAPYRATA